MPARRRISTPEVQGDDSWVEIIPLTWGESRGLGELSGEGTLALVCRHVVAWNWTDGDGRELAQPGGGVECFEALTDAEVRALVRLVLDGPHQPDLKAIHDAAFSYFWTQVGDLPDEATELMLCGLYHCPPSMVDEQAAAQVMRHLAYLNGKAEAFEQRRRAGR